MTLAIERRERGREIRAALSKEDNLKRLYTFFLNLCGSSSCFDVEQFRRIIKEGDRRKIWSLSGVTVWSAPFILLQLSYFKAVNEKGEAVCFHFHLKEKKNSSEKRYHFLYRYLSGGIPLNYPKGNPYPMTEEVWNQYSKDYHWLGEEKYRNLLKSLENAFAKKRAKR